MADKLTMKNFSRVSRAVLLNTMTLMINAIPYLQISLINKPYKSRSLTPQSNLRHLSMLKKQELSLPGSAVEFMAVGEDTDVHFLKASSPDKGFTLF